MTSGRSAVVLAAVSAALVFACAGSAAGGPVFWPTEYVQKQVYDHYAHFGDVDVACAAVGPEARQKGVELFGEFACDVTTEIGELVVAVVPTSANHWKILKPGDPSPVGGPLQGIAAAGSARHLALVNNPPHTVTLDDESTWKIVDKLNQATHWRTGDIVMIEPDQSKTHLYRVVDKTRDVTLEADFLGFS